MTAGNLKEELSLETNPSLTTLAIEDMVYKGEGNAHIVIALPYERRVIRFRKSLPGEVSPDGGKTRAQREVWYARNVVSCFLGSYAQIPEIVRYDAADIAKLSDAIRPRRPEKRRHKVITDTYATKFPDYTFLDLRLEIDQTVFRGRSTFCVEIKPKQGYLQKAERQFPGCPYCLNQYAKLRKGDIAACSNYCPFELFSGVKARMKTVVKELLRSPQNNLRIFKNGIVVYNQESSPNDLEDVLNEWFRNATTTSSGRARRSNVDEFCSLVYAALTLPFTQEQLEESSTACCPCNFPQSANQAPTFCAEPDAIARAERCLRLAGKNCNFVGDELPRNSVLERIRNMQRLSYVNTNYIYGIYSDFASLLNDDMIYSDLMKLQEENHASTISRALPGKLTKAKDIKEINSEKLFESIVAREYDNNSNGNHNASSECILSTNVKKIVVNSDFASQTEISANLDSCRLFYGNTSLHNQETNDDDNEQKANMQIIAKHLSTLRNYLLFATARDCSILMTFRELLPENLSKVPVENTIKLSEQLSFLSSVKVSDLDPKSVHSIEKHRQRDVDIFDSVTSLLEDLLFKSIDDHQRNSINNSTVQR
ncbi:inositol-pentakisphosphate 2-kinase isoform X1 [Formica exsecta]|uniref:inositol-pentakisphosphate 2-kinase isoform X1 n=1 Tax=Formica exsecta TaxID=72781 RepID=UPI0011435D55|nr:inositol-pentakisphosphate 2-kinase isoform X1 [Formica exsecta]XP_029659169.1 inositol-pentakisphosphate 2-kinase isoform X1 [Formica exsecta]